MKSRVLAAAGSLFLIGALVCAYFAYHAHAFVLREQRRLEEVQPRIEGRSDRAEIENLYRIGIRNQTEQRTLTTGLAAGSFLLGLAALGLAYRARRTARR